MMKYFLGSCFLGPLGVTLLRKSGVVAVEYPVGVWGVFEFTSGTRCFQARFFGVCS